MEAVELLLLKEAVCTIDVLNASIKKKKQALVQRILDGTHNIDLNAEVYIIGVKMND